VVVTAWKLDLQLHVQLMFITTKSCEFDPSHGESARYVIKCVSDLRHVGGIRWFPPPVKLKPRYIVESGPLTP